MSNVVDITPQIERRRSYTYPSGSAAIERARALADRLLDNTNQLLIPTTDVLPAICELRAIVRGDADWPGSTDERIVR